MMGKKVSPAVVARTLDVHYNTVYRWCRWSVAGDPRSVLCSVQQHPLTGYFSIDLDEVRELKDSGKDLSSPDFGIY
jgi:hypothetical protein